MEGFSWPQTSSSRLSRRYGIPARRLGYKSDDVSSEEIEKKKKVVSDLMALRRMKVRQNAGNSPLSVTLRTPGFPQDINAADVQPLLENTILNEELINVYGEEAAIQKATEHFSTVTSNLRRPQSRQDVEFQRIQFVNQLVETRKNKLEKSREERVNQHQKLLTKKTELKQKEKSQTALLQEDLPDLVENTEKNLKAMEKNLRSLKLKYADDLSSISKENARQMEFKAFIAAHPKQVEIVSWIIDLLLENVHQQCIENEKNSLESKIMEMFLQADMHQFEELQMKTARFDAILAVMNQIVEEASSDLIKNLSEECIFLAHMAVVYSDDLIINSTDNAVTGTNNRKSKKPDKIVEESFLSIRSTRNRLKKEVWNHSDLIVQQDFPDLTPTPNTDQPVVKPPTPAVDSGLDSVAISSNDAIPKHDSLFGSSKEMEDYGKCESSLWNQCVADIQNIAFAPTPTLGISVACLTSDHSLFAVGSYRGDILVYNMMRQLPLLIRNVVFYGKSTDALISIQWSLDNSRLVTLTEQGCVAVWSVSFAPYVSESQESSLEVPHDVYYSQQLTALCILEFEKGDFTFQDESFLQESGPSQPNLVRFDPSMSMYATQNSIVVALKNGDIFKCNLTNNIQMRFCNSLVPGLKPAFNKPSYVLGKAVKAEKVHKIGQDVETELFRCHRSSVLQLCFIRNGGDMISFDSTLNLCQWKHDSQQLSSFGWFVPLQKFKLLFFEEVLVPKGEDNVIFEDVIALKLAGKGKKTKSKSTIEQERRRALLELQNLQINSDTVPWYTDELPDELEGKIAKSKKPSKFITRIYSSPGDYMSDAAAGGATFTVTTVKRATDQVVKVAFRTYVSDSNSAVTLLHTAIAPAGDRIHFMLLFDEELPKIRKHVSFIELDLDRMQLGRVGPIHINLPSEKFTECYEGNAAFFSISRVDEMTGTEYIASIICGNLQVYSLLSGKPVMSKAPKKESSAVFDGLVLPVRMTKLASDCRVIFVKPDGKVSYLIALPLRPAKGGFTTKTLQISEEDYSANSTLRASYKILTQLKEQLDEEFNSATEIGWYKHEQTCQKDFFSHRHMPLELYMRLTLNTIIDIVLARSTGERIPQENRKKIWKNDWIMMQKYFAGK